MARNLSIVLIFILVSIWFMKHRNIKILLIVQQIALHNCWLYYIVLSFVLFDQCSRRGWRKDLRGDDK